MRSSCNPSSSGPSSHDDGDSDSDGRGAAAPDWSSGLILLHTHCTRGSVRPAPRWSARSLWPPWGPGPPPASWAWRRRGAAGEDRAHSRGWRGAQRRACASPRGRRRPVDQRATARGSPRRRAPPGPRPRDLRLTCARPRSSSSPLSTPPAIVPSISTPIAAGSRAAGAALVEHAGLPSAGARRCRERTTAARR